jgi:type II secretory ATPase GspE/PulE/Tfp pilus assembly ATPase PilB-like protein
MPDALPPAMYARVRQAVGGALPRVRVTGGGCEHCAMHGTVGRSVLAEVIVPDDQFFKFIRAGDKCAAVAYWLEHLDGRTMLGHAIDKIAAGQIDPRMAEKVVGHLVGPASRLEAIHAV